jgi:imidazolonepropionase
MKRLFTHIATLAGILPEGILRKQGTEMDQVGTLENAWLLTAEGRIADFGQGPAQAADETVDCAGALLMPAF